MAPDRDRAVTIALTEVRVGRGSVDFLIKIAKDVLDTGLYPNLKFKIRATTRTMHLPTVAKRAAAENAAEGIAYAPLDEHADRIGVALQSTEYVLGEDVDYQIEYDSKRPLIVFKGTLSPDVLLDLVDGAYNGFLPGVL
jgi:hypothetical protein